MLEQLKLIMGAVAKKDIVPVLTHVHVLEGALQASNGRILLHAPAPDVHDMGHAGVNVPGKKLYQAVQSAGNRPLRWQTLEDGRLRMKAGRMQVTLPLSTEQFPTMDPPTQREEVTKGALEDVLRTLRPFVAQDGSKPWASGVLLDPAGYAYATNNVAIVRGQFRALAALPEPLNIPVDTVDEVLRLSKAVGPVQWWHLEEGALYLGWDNGMWMHTVRLVNEWPDQRAEIIEGPSREGAPTTGEGLQGVRQAVQAVVPFSPDEKAPAVKFTENGVQTLEGDTEAHVEIEGLPEGHYRSEVLDPVLKAADRVWFNQWPSPIPFEGPGVEGVFLGLRA